MEISPESKYARVQILHHTFSRLTEFYRPANRMVAWRAGSDGTEISPDYLWGEYAQSVEQVRNNFMLSTETRIDRHKIIALTERVILESQPLIFTSGNVSADEHYRLNAEYAFLFGLQFLTRWHEVYYPEPFYSDRFIALLTTDKGKVFSQEHIKLLCVKSRQPFPIFWCSQLWFLLEWVGLTHMEHATKFPPHPPV